MNSAEAKAVLEAELAKYRTRPYRELVTLTGKTQRTEITAQNIQLLCQTFSNFADSGIAYHA